VPRPNDLIGIGDFARRVRLTPKQLRDYDENGLLDPAYVDADTGYRDYHRGQARTAVTIALLRSLDVPLPAVHDLLVADDVAPLLDLQRARIEAEVELLLITRDLEATKRFYEDLLGLQPVFEADWFVQLANDDAELGFVVDGHPSIPARLQGQTQTAALVTVEVDDASAAYERAGQLGLDIELEPAPRGMGSAALQHARPRRRRRRRGRGDPVTSAAIAAQYVR
jgi:DNA-binding transcriptional MerR regulator